jgi:hypothetical protein
MPRVKMNLFLLVTFKDLQKLIESQQNPVQSRQLDRFRDKRFWYWDKGRHEESDRANNGDCCFNHIIGPTEHDKLITSLRTAGLTMQRISKRRSRFIIS